MMGGGRSPRQTESTGNYHFPVLWGIVAAQRLECRTSSQDLDRAFVIGGLKNQIMPVPFLVGSIGIEDFDSRLGKFDADGTRPSRTIDRADQDDWVDLALESRGVKDM